MGTQKTHEMKQSYVRKWFYDSSLKMMDIDIDKFTAEIMMSCMCSRKTARELIMGLAPNYPYNLSKDFKTYLFQFSKVREDTDKEVLKELEEEFSASPNNYQKV